MPMFAEYLYTVCIRKEKIRLYDVHLFTRESETVSDRAL